MLELLFILLLLVVSFFPSILTFAVTGGALYAFAIVLYSYVGETIINCQEARDEQLHHHATEH